MKLLKRVVTVSLLVSALSMSGITGVSAVTSVYGDVNNDGVVNSADMVCMNNFLGGNLEVSATQLAKFDLNNNKFSCNSETWDKIIRFYSEGKDKYREFYDLDSDEIQELLDKFSNILIPNHYGFEFYNN